jgi:hypothetical protein
MTTMKTSLNQLIVALVGIAAFGSPLAQAANPAPSIIYDNSTTAAGTFVAPPAGSSDFGNQIVFPAGTGRIITDFKFQYFLSGGTGSQTADLRLYANNGGAFQGTPSQMPGQLLYDSTPVPILNGNSSVIDMSGLNVNTFSTLTWTVSFGGITSSQKVGLLPYGPPTVGTSFSDFWVNLGTQASPNWFIENIGGGTASFAAQVTAVPEPTVVQFGIVAGLAGLSMLGLRRRSTK